MPLALRQTREAYTEETIRQPLCEDTSPTTGKKCRKNASILTTRFGEPFVLCGECALRHYLRGWALENY
jgi:hypothetical protein